MVYFLKYNSVNAFQPTFWFELYDVYRLRRSRVHENLTQFLLRDVRRTVEKVERLGRLTNAWK